MARWASEFEGCKRETRRDHSNGMHLTARNRLADWLRLRTSGWADAMGREDNVGARVWVWAWWTAMPAGLGGSRTNREATARDCHVRARAGAGGGELLTDAGHFAGSRRGFSRRNEVNGRTARGRAGIASTRAACARGRRARGCPGTPHLAGLEAKAFRNLTSGPSAVLDGGDPGHSARIRVERPPSSPRAILASGPMVACRGGHDGPAPARPPVLVTCC